MKNEIDLSTKNLLLTEEERIKAYEDWFERMRNEPEYVPYASNNRRVIEVVSYRKIWNEEQIKYLMWTNETVLYSCLKELYCCQTQEEKAIGNTQEHNGIGFNAYDAPFLSAMIKDLNKYGHLTYGQRDKTKRMLQKYSKQLVKLANDKKYNKEVNVVICDEQNLSNE